MAPRVNLRSSAVKRIMQEAAELADPDTDDFVAAPLESDIFEWHCTLRGVPGTDYEGGLYHLRIILPPSYPMSAPDIVLMTPSGRFELGKKICIDGLTSFHAGSWQPAWGVRTAITGLRAFWTQDGEALSAIGALDYPKDERRRLAKLSRDWTCPTCNATNVSLLPDPTVIKKEAEPQASSSSPPLATGSTFPAMPVVTAPAPDDQPHTANSDADASVNVDSAASALPLPAVGDVSAGHVADSEGAGSRTGPVVDETASPAASHPDAALSAPSSSTLAGVVLPVAAVVPVPSVGEASTARAGDVAADELAAAPPSAVVEQPQAQTSSTPAFVVAAQPPAAQPVAPVPVPNGRTNNHITHHGNGNTNGNANVAFATVPARFTAVPPRRRGQRRASPMWLDALIGALVVLLLALIARR